MVKKLRKRVIIYTTVAVFLVLLILMGVVNAVNYVSRDRAATELLEYLAENGGMFPNHHGGMIDGQGEKGEKGDNGEKGEKGEEGGHEAGGFVPGEVPLGIKPGMTEETPFETRFFTVDLKNDGTIKSVDTGKIAAVDSSRAVEMVEAAEESGKTTGYNGNYKYLLTETEDGKRYIFVDRTRDLEAVKSFLKTSVLVSLAGLAAITLLVILLSPKMIRPVAESYAKQKEFITNAGHELKTPMAVIESCTEVIEMQSGETKWTQGIREQVKKLSDLTTNMVALAKMDEGPGEMLMQELNLSELVNETLEGFELEAEQKGFVIEKNIEDGIMIKGNTAGLRELVSILADNAIKYGEKEEPIKFTLSRQGKKVVLTEENFTEEIDKENLNKIFDRFYRGDTSHSSDKPGTGIGLSMAQSVVHAHGGTISAESPDGKKFIITARI